MLCFTGIASPHKQKLKSAYLDVRFLDIIP